MEKIPVEGAPPLAAARVLLCLLPRKMRRRRLILSPQCVIIAG